MYQGVPLDSSTADIAGFFATWMTCIFVFALLAVAFNIWMFWRILTKAGFSGWLSLLNLIGGLGTFAVTMILAFGDWPALRKSTPSYMPPTGGYSPPPSGGYGGYAPPVAPAPTYVPPAPQPTPPAPAPVVPEPVAAPEPVVPEPVAPEPIAPEPVAEPAAPEPVAPEPAEPADAEPPAPPAPPAPQA